VGLVMTYATNNVGDAIRQIGDGIKWRCQNDPLLHQAVVVRTPVALMFVRGDRAEPGASLAKQVVASFGYWNTESSKYLDLVFFGWFKDGGEVGFQSWDNGKIFLDCVEEVQKLSRWRYSGETDILLVDFEMDAKAGGELTNGRFSFKNCIYLPVEEMIAEKRVRSLDALVHELVDAGKEVFEASQFEGSVFEMSDRIAWIRGKKVLWDRLKNLFLRDWAKVYDELRPFAVCDLSVVV
jgi:hypothetical protein